jgi:hypothetical protein
MNPVIPPASVITSMKPQDICPQKPRGFILVSPTTIASKQALLDKRINSGLRSQDHCPVFLVFLYSTLTLAEQALVMNPFL